MIFFTGRGWLVPFFPVAIFFASMFLCGTIFGWDSTKGNYLGGIGIAVGGIGNWFIGKWFEKDPERRDTIYGIPFKWTSIPIVAFGAWFTYFMLTKQA